MLTAQELLGLLAEEDRLRVVAALVLGATTPAEIAAASGLAPRAVGRALARLSSGGLVERVATTAAAGSAASGGEREDPAAGPRAGSGAGSGYRVCTEVLRQAAAQARPEPEHWGPGDEAAAVLGRFIRGNKLVSIPTARAKRLLVLDYLASLFEPGQRYTEAEVNQALQAWHEDFASLRRYLVDEGFLEREDERDPGGARLRKVYWRAGGSFDPGREAQPGRR